MYPVLLEENFVIEDCDFAISSGADLIARIYDYDTATLWKSVGSNDTVTETVEVRFKEGQTLVNKTFDRIYLIKHNLKDFKVQYSTNGTVWNDITETIKTTNTDENNSFSFSAITAGWIKLIMNKTITADQEKQVTEFYVGSYKYTLLTEPTDYNVRYFKKDGEINLATGRRKKWIIGTKDNPDRERWSGRFRFDFITEAERQSLKEIYLEHKSFTVIPEPAAQPQEFYLVNWANLWNRKYSRKSTQLGFSVEIILGEV